MNLISSTKISIFSALILGLTTIISPVTTFAAVNAGEAQTKSVQASTNSVMGDWETVRYLGTYDHTFTSSEILRNSIVEKIIFAGLAIPSSGAALGLDIAKSLAEYKTVDTVALGGVYTDKYYVRKIVYPNQSTVNVPVLYEFEYWTIFYKHQYHKSTEVAYINKISDGQRLDSN